MALNGTVRKRGQPTRQLDEKGNSHEENMRLVFSSSTHIKTERGWKRLNKIYCRGKMCKKLFFSISQNCDRIVTVSFEVSDGSQRGTLQVGK